LLPPHPRRLPPAESAQDSPPPHLCIKLQPGGLLLATGSKCDCTISSSICRAGRGRGRLRTNVRHSLGPSSSALQLMRCLQLVGGARTVSDPDTTTTASALWPVAMLHCFTVTPSQLSITTPSVCIESCWLSMRTRWMRTWKVVGTVVPYGSGGPSDVGGGGRQQLRRVQVRVALQNRAGGTPGGSPV